MRKTKSVMFPIMAVFALLATGCRKPYPTPIIREIGPHQTAYLISLDDGPSGQAKFNSIEYLDNHRIAQKRVEIPQRWLQTGRRGWNGEWIPTKSLIVVDRTPVARRWTDEVGTGTSPGIKLLSAESRDSIGVNSGFAITAAIKEEDVSKFLYYYPNGQLAQIMDNQLFNDCQAIYSEVSSKYNVSELRAKKDEINLAMVERLVETYAKQGITIYPSMGLIGGLMYDNPKIQASLDEVFIAQNREEKAKADVRAQIQENEREVSIEKAEADKRKIRADAEAYAINAVAEAIRNGGEEYVRIRSLEVMANAILKWNGSVPTTFAAGGSSGMFSHLLLNSPSVEKSK